MHNPNTIPRPDGFAIFFQVKNTNHSNTFTGNRTYNPTSLSKLETSIKTFHSLFKWLHNTRQRATFIAGKDIDFPSNSCFCEFSIIRICKASNSAFAIHGAQNVAQENVLLLTKTV
jgi:hypothetical protein